MADDKKNESKFPFIGKKPEDYTNDGDTVSQEYRKFNNADYVKKFNTYSKQWNASTVITNNSQTYKLGDTVQVSENADKKAGMKGKICIGFTLENASDMLCVQFKDGKKEMMDKGCLTKICEQDYNKD
jgi:hypothetical protein